MFWYRGTRDEVLMLPRSMSRGTLGCIEGTRDEVLYAAARDGRWMMEDGRCFCCRLRILLKIIDNDKLSKKY